MTGKIISLSVLLLGFATTFPACDHDKTTAQAQGQNAADAARPALTFPPESGPVPVFDGNRAMQYVKEIVAFGPRPRQRES